MRKKATETIKYIIIDDDYLSIEYLRDLMKIHTDFQCIGECLDVMTAFKMIEEKKPDIIFLDIDMPTMNGLQMLKHIDVSNMKVIITTAHRKYALESYNHFVFNFLTKPIVSDRLFDCMKQLKIILLNDKKINNDLFKIIEEKKKLPYIFASRHREKSSIQIDKSEIYYITKANNQVEIYTLTDGPFYVDGSLREYIQILPENDFSFANQSYIFNIHKAECKDGENIIFNKEKNINIKISPAYRCNFIKKL